MPKSRIERPGAMNGAPSTAGTDAEALGGCRERLEPGSWRRVFASASMYSATSIPLKAAWQRPDPADELVGYGCGVRRSESSASSLIIRCELISATVSVLHRAPLRRQVSELKHERIRRSGRYLAPFAAADPRAQSREAPGATGRARCTDHSSAPERVRHVDAHGMRTVSRPRTGT